MVFCIFLLCSIIVFKVQMCIYITVEKKKKKLFLLGQYYGVKVPWSIRWILAQFLDILRFEISYSTWCVLCDKITEKQFCIKYPSSVLIVGVDIDALLQTLTEMKDAWWAGKVYLPTYPVSSKHNTQL